jgi:hypothetical protein
MVTSVFFLGDLYATCPLPPLPQVGRGFSRFYGPKTVQAGDAYICLSTHSSEALQKTIFEPESNSPPQKQDFSSKQKQSSGTDIDEPEDHSPTTL